MSAFFSNPGNVLLTDSQPALNMANQAQAQDVNLSVDAQDKNAVNTLDSAKAQAQQSAYQSAQQISNQALAFSGSGVRLEGTPMQVLNTSRQLAIQSVSNIMKQGLNQANLQLTNAAITANQGRAALLGNTNKFETDLANSTIQNNTDKSNFVMTAAKAAIDAAMAP